MDMNAEYNLMPDGDQSGENLCAELPSSLKDRLRKDEKELQIKMEDCAFSPAAGTQESTDTAASLGLSPPKGGILKRKSASSSFAEDQQDPMCMHSGADRSDMRQSNRVTFSSEQGTSRGVWANDRNRQLADHMLCGL